MTCKRFPHHWPFVRRIHQLLMAFLHQCSVIQTFDDIRLPEQALEQTASNFRWFETPWRSCDATVILPDGNVQPSSAALFFVIWFVWHLQLTCINSLATGEFEWNYTHVIFKQILVIDGWGIPCKIALMWISLDFTNDQSALVQVMAWCRQATSHYIGQCWSRSLLPYGVARPQWVYS